MRCSNYFGAADWASLQIAPDRQLLLMGNPHHNRWELLCAAEDRPEKLG